MSDTKTVSGNIVHIQDKGAPTALSVIANITPKQSGTGTPSPSNVRAISGWESVNVYVSPTEDETDGHTTTTPLGRTVYGGTLDVVSGVLTVDRGIVTFDGSSDEQYVTGSYGMAFRTYLPNDFKPTTNNRELAGLVSNQMTEVTQASTWGTVGTCAVIANSTQLYFKLASDLTDISALRTYLASNPLQVCYELATPQTYTLTGQNVALLKDCYAWADSGDISITYETYLINGLFHKIWINGVKMFAPNDFTLERSDVYAGEITTCTGKTIADRIGWKYADMSLNWDYLPQEYLETILNLSGVFTITFENEEGVQFTEQCIRKGSTMTGTRFTDNAGNMMWKGVQFDISFINVHN